MSQTHPGEWPYSSSPCARVALPLDLQSLSRSTRREHRRREHTWSRMATERDVRYRRTCGPGELLDAFQHLRRLHQARWAEQLPLPGIAPSAGSLQWEPVLRNCPEAFVATLAVDGDVLAAQLCLQGEETVYSVVPAMDPAHKHIAVGHALLRALIADLTSAGFRTLDLGRTVNGQTYKSQYAPRWSRTLSARLPSSLTTAA
ncbi:GNAT family N-acetyltransferase [Streptomyces sp. NPDC047049]|uniref:GNAT family N-acetyltransferase n=1 Tax=Streptomyces sp. NPDC047049 TaxID=3156688 RepID=UPI0033EFA538